MSTTQRLVHATPDAVWEVLADGWRYPGWVVGAARMRAVSEDWPAVGATLDHSVGTWPALLDDRTEVLECHAPTRLRLRARGWPIGEAEIDMRLAADGAGTQVTMIEQVTAGPGRLLPAPVRDAQIHWRNTETLHRLALQAERRSG